METVNWSSLQVSYQFRTDPTYKEWKLIKKVGCKEYKSCTVGTDPTYKEWKRNQEEYATMLLSCTDPTYKEWKPHQYTGAFCLGSCKHGSYLQGMETAGLLTLYWHHRCTDPTYKEWKLGVLT